MNTGAPVKPGIKNSSENFEHLWKQISSTHEGEAWRTLHLDEAEVEIYLDQNEAFTLTDTEERNLGPVFRLWFVLEFLEDHYTQKGSQKRLHRRSAGDRTSPKPTRPKIFEHAFALGRQDERPFDGSTATTMSRRVSIHNDKVFADKLGRWPAVLKGLSILISHVAGESPEALVQKLFVEEYTGADAIAQFKANLQPDDHEEQTLFFIAESAERKAQCKELVDLMVLDPDVSYEIPLVGQVAGTPMLINVYGDGQWRDLAALAQTLEVDARNRIRDKKPDENIVHKRVVRISLARFAQDQSENPGAFALTLDALLSTLCEKLRIRKSDVALHKDQISTFAMVREVRKRLAEEPHVLIFDGYYEFSAESEDNAIGVEMLRVARDDHLKKLLMSVLEPPIASTSGYPDQENLAVAERDITTDPIDVLMYQRNRIVVISNRKLSYFSGPATKQRADVKLIPLEAPQKDDVRKILENCHLTYRAAIADMVELNPHFEDLVYEPFFDLLNSYLMLACGPDYEASKSGACEAVLNKLVEGAAMPPVNQHEKLMDWLMHQYMELLRDENPLSFDLHVFLSIIPCGLRRLTMARLARRVRGMTIIRASNNKSVGPPLQKLFWANPKDLDEAALCVPGSLLTDQQTDSFKSYDDAPLPAETVLLERAAAATEDKDKDKDKDEDVEWPDGILDFFDPVMKESVGRILVNSKFLKPWQLALLNRHLSEEAMSQQIIAMRFRGSNHTPSIREFRRLVSGLYHGLLSLEIVAKKGQPDFANTHYVHCPYMAGPMDAREFYRWLCILHYRAILEAPPAWRLSRYYSLDRLKLDILEALDRPFDLIRVYQQKGRFDLAASMIEHAFLEDTPEMVEDLLINVTHASTGVSNTSKTNKTDLRRSAIASAARKKLESKKPKVQETTDMKGGKWKARVRRDRLAPELGRLKDRLNRNVLSAEYSAQECWLLLWIVVNGASISSVLKRWEEVKVADQNANRLKFLESQLGKLDDKAELKSNLDKATIAGMKKFLNIWFNGGSAEAHHAGPDFSDQIKQIVSAFNGNDAVLVNFMDVLFRVSEFTAIEGDALFSYHLLKEEEDTSRLVNDKIDTIFSWHASTLRDRNTKTYHVHLYCLSFAVFQMAEQLRLYLLNTHPVANHFYGAGHAARQAVRTAIFLERGVRRRGTRARAKDPTSALDMRLGYFIGEARRTTERLCHHLHSYPRERAGLMILESKLHRVLSEPSKKPDDWALVPAKEKRLRLRSLREAMRYLGDAENIVIGMSRRNRVRMRLAQERSKINIALADLQTDRDIERRFLELALYDVVDLKRRADASSDILVWKVVIAREVAKLNVRIEQFNKGPKGRRKPA